MQQKILLLAANPKGTTPLRLDEEVREIDAGLQRAKHREQFVLAQKWAVQPRDIQRAMLDLNPSIVHFSGHGTGDEGLVFEDETGMAKLVDGEALAGLFDLFADQVECVVLNGCYSQVQATAIARHVNYVIGMNKAIGDRAAIEFAVAFYDALGAGRPIEFAHKFACAAIRLAGIPEQLTPVLKKKPGIGETIATLRQPEDQDFKDETMSEASDQAIKVFFSYAHEDENLRDELAKHLKLLQRQGVIKAWHDREISAGTEWAGSIDAHMDTANIILLLISADFLASDYCYDIELTRAMERHVAQEARVIPVILREVDWKGAPFGKLQALPKDALPVTNWENRDRAFTDVARGIRKAVEELTSKTSDVENLPDPHPPLAEPKFPSGTVPLDSAFYVERPPVEFECYDAIKTPGALLRVKAQQKMGKTLLVDRILSQARNEGYRIANMSLELPDSKIFNDIHRFSRRFCAVVSQELKLPPRLNDYWNNDFLGNNDKTTNYFEDYLLSTFTNPIILALDKVDRVFESAIADDFCSLLRGWHDLAKRSDRRGDIWKRLRLVVVHSTDVYGRLDINRSPLAGVGLHIRLLDFNLEQVQDLARQHGLDWESNQEVEQLMGMVGGHPYLIHLAFEYLKSQKGTLEKLLQIAASTIGDNPFSEHLQEHLGNLKRYLELEAAFRKVVMTNQPVQIESDLIFKLDSMGLIQIQNDGCTVRYNLYRQYFSSRLTAT